MADDYDPIVLESERLAITKIPRATWNRLERAGDTPERNQLSPRRRGWRRGELLSWIESRRVKREHVDVCGTESQSNSRLALLSRKA
jgi:predicted DNA-binding transcriptional regulator AlpA